MDQGGHCAEHRRENQTGMNSGGTLHGGLLFGIAPPFGNRGFFRLRFWMDLYTDLGIRRGLAEKCFFSLERIDSFHILNDFG